MKHWTHVGIALALSSLVSHASPSARDHETAVRDVNARYVSAWLANDADAVMALFEPEAIIVPSGQCPIVGRDAVRAFWFPNDGSVTTIHKFTSEIVTVRVDDNVAFTAQSTTLRWSYEKDGAKLSKEQQGYAMTILRRQADGGWRIWKQSWNDVASKDV